MTTAGFLPLAFQAMPEAEMLERIERFEALMRRRRTVRDFSPEPVPRAVIESAIRTAAGAPSGRQPAALDVRGHRRSNPQGAHPRRRRASSAPARNGWKPWRARHRLAQTLFGDRALADFVIGAYHRLFHIEASFRMSKHDLAARPIYHHKRESIDAHLTVVFAALAVGRLIEDRTGWSIRRFVRTARRYRTVQIRAGSQLLTAEDPIPDDLRDALARITGTNGAH
jgi:hypothetical protein